MEPWEESLDIDDSDIPSLLLRPCLNRQHLDSHSHCNSGPSSISSQPPDSRFAPSHPLIPGPAGAVQAAMIHRRGQYDVFVSEITDQEKNPISTQEYIKMVLEKGQDPDDVDFTKSSWLKALEFLRTEGLVETPLATVKNSFDADKVARVVAFIKACNSNGLGGFLVTLKDPTDTMNATIHHKVFSEGEIGKALSVGAVLVLQKVAVFSPSRYVQYLNITSSNVIMVISKDGASVVKQNDIVSSYKHSAKTKGSRISEMAQPILSQERTERIMNRLKEISKSSGKAHVDCVTESNTINGSSYFSSQNSRNRTASLEEASMLTENMVNDITEMPDREENACKDREVMMDEQSNLCQLSGGDNSLFSKHTIDFAFESVDDTVGREDERIIRNKKQLPTSKSLLLQWTEEQLDELFAFD